MNNEVALLIAKVVEHHNYEVSEDFDIVWGLEEACEEIFGIELDDMARILEDILPILKK